jgi:xylosylprotein 4-beta-galactosyltransferase
MIASQDSKDKYSIIIPYRNREEHLQVMLPRLKEVFKDKNYEIIVSEQNDDNPFNIACVQDIAYNYCDGNIIILHQVDYYPTDDVSYDISDQPVLPAKKGIFVDKDLSTSRPLDDIPGGYRNWSNEIDSNFYGGVVIMRKEHWEKINGINPMYEGWGNEDEDLRERFKWAGYTPVRNTIGTFYCLYHEDNGDIASLDKTKQEAFIKGRQILENAFNFKNVGYKNLTADVEIFDCGIDKVKWIKSTNYIINENIS